jgi:hypothetical protein
MYRQEGGVFFEFAYNPICSMIDQQSPKDLVEMIWAAGVENNVLASDHGISDAANGVAWPHPTEAMAAFVGLLQKAGFSTADIRTMACDNPSKLLGI